MVRLAICTWGAYVVFLRGKHLKTQIWYWYYYGMHLGVNWNNETLFTVKKPSSDEDENATDNSSTVIPSTNDYGITTGLLFTVVVLYWSLMFLFCCCRVFQREERYTRAIHDDGFLCTVECLECCSQCSEDLGKGQCDDGKGGMYILLGGLNILLFYLFYLITANG